MSNRANSFLRRFKTEKTQRNNLYNYKPQSKTPTNRNHLPNHSYSIKDIKQRPEKIQLKLKDDYLIKCLNHPMKRATFESKQSLNQAYCQQCSIKFVKCNIRMIKITQESLYIRSLFQAQLQKLNTYEHNIKEMVYKYFETQRQGLKSSFIKVKQSKENPIRLPYFKIQSYPHKEFTSKIKEIFGTVENKLVEFINISSHYQNENNNVLNLYTNSNNHNLIEKTNTINIQGNTECPYIYLDKQKRNQINLHKQNPWEDRTKRLSAREAHKSVACLR